MSFPIGFPPVARQPPQTTDPGPGASDEARVSFVQSLSKLGEYDRRLYLSSLLVDAARNGDVQTISQLNSLLDGRDQMVLTEALEAAAENGHGEIINIMFRGRAWLWAIVKFPIMARLVENYDAGNPGYRKAFMDLFSRVPSERPYVPEFGDAAAYESELSQLLIKVEKRDPKLSEWCQRTLDDPRMPPWQ
jgi:hypothetical protein